MHRLCLWNHRDRQVALRYGGHPQYKELDRFGPVSFWPWIISAPSWFSLCCYTTPPPPPPPHSGHPQYKELDRFGPVSFWPWVISVLCWFSLCCYTPTPHPPPSSPQIVFVGLWGVFCSDVRLSIRTVLVFQYFEKAVMELYKIWQTHWYPQDEHSYWKIRAKGQ